MNFGSEKTLFSSEDSRKLLTSVGIDSLGAAFRQGQVVFDGRHDHKQVACLSIDVEGAPKKLFIKRQMRNPRLLPKLRDFRDYGPFTGDPVREWHGLNLVRSWGLSAAEPLALFTRRLSAESAVVTAGVPGEHSLRELARGSFFDDLDGDSQRMLVDAICRSIHTIHDRGYGWRGMDARHLFPERRSDGEYRIWLIDCEGVYRQRNVSAVDRDLMRLRKSLSKSAVPEAFIRHLMERLQRR
jgi:hypothetical protein